MNFRVVHLFWFIYFSVEVSFTFSVKNYIGIQDVF